MRPEDLQARLRPRRAWEASDLGVVMLRRWLRPVAVAWAWSVAPLMLVLVTLAWWLPLLSALLIWWLKPLWDRVVLYVLSRSLFGAVPTARSVLSAKLWRLAPLETLIWLRLDPARSFLGPIRTLEGGDRDQTRRRRTHLAQEGTQNAAFGLTFACLGLEVMVLLGVLGALYTVLPDSPRYDIQNLLDIVWQDGLPRLAGPILVGAYAVAVSIVEPLYVASGFGLYLNRRTWLEGWDVELSFRQLAGRLRAAGLLLSALILCLPTAAVAAELEPQETIEVVLQDPQFGQSTDQTTYRLRFDLSEWFRADDEAVAEVTWVAEVLRALLLGLLGITLMGLLIGLLQHRGALRRPRWQRQPTRTPAPVVAGALMPAPRGLPEDVAQAARARLTAGDDVGALSLLYRGAIAHLIAQQRLEIPAGATEAECLESARTILPPDALRYLRSLTQAWVRGAYGDGPPEGADGLVSDWDEHFRGTP